MFMTSNLFYRVLSYLTFSSDLLQFSRTCLTVDFDVSGENLAGENLPKGSYLYPNLENSQLLLSQCFGKVHSGGAPCSLCFMRCNLT